MRLFREHTPDVPLYSREKVLLALNWLYVRQRNLLKGRTYKAAGLEVSDWSHRVEARVRTGPDGLNPVMEQGASRRMSLGSVRD